MHRQESDKYLSVCCPVRGADGGIGSEITTRLHFRNDSFIAKGHSLRIVCQCLPRHRRACVKFWTRMTKRWWRSFTLDMTWYVDSRCVTPSCVRLRGYRNSLTFVEILDAISTAERERFLSTRLYGTTRRIIVYRSGLRAMSRRFANSHRSVRIDARALSRKRKRNYHEPIIFNEINNM